MYYFLIQLKRKLEQVLMSPWIWLGRRYARKHPLNAPYDIFFFFPIYSIGGAEKVNIEIVKAFPDKRIMVFFTKKSKDSALLHDFRQPNVTIHDISAHTDNKRKYWKSFIWRGICSQYVRQQAKPPVVFVGQCNFGYKLLPHLPKEVRTVELIHNKIWQFAMVVLPYVPFIDCRIMIASFIKQAYLAYYRKLGIPEEFDSRIRIIRNAIEVPPPEPKAEDNILKVLFAGRGGVEKRLPLLFQVIRLVHKLNYPIQFHLAGDYAEQLPEDIRGIIVWHGQIAESKVMYELQRNMDVFMLLSLFEGMPIAVMEAMAHSTIPIATAVGGIPEMIEHEETGLLLYAEQEEEIVQSAVMQLHRLIQDKSFCKYLSANAYRYAERYFSIQKFHEAYRNALYL